MRYLKRTGFAFAVTSLLIFTACGFFGNSQKNSFQDVPGNAGDNKVEISITQTLSVRVGETKTLYVTRRNTNDFTLSVNPTSGSGCIKSGNDAVKCTPTAAGIYTVTVTATADASQKSSARVTVGENDDEYLPEVPSLVDEIINLVWKYSPDSRYIFESEAISKNTTIDELISRWYYGDTDVFNLLDLAVHETYHGYQFSGGIEFDNNYNVLYYKNQFIDNTNVKVYYPGNNIIKTEEALSSLPVRLRTFRWQSYVSSDSLVSANQHGAYGLLDELSAYYYGGKSVADCHEYLMEYFDIYGFSEDLTMSYFGIFGNSKVAFYEFKYWTLEYLLYLKEYYPGDYKSIMDNENYKKAFKYIHNCFEQLAENTMSENIHAVLARLNSMNIETSEGDDWIRIGNTVISMEVYTKDINTIKNEIGAAKYADMLKELLM